MLLAIPRLCLPSIRHTLLNQEKSYWALLEVQFSQKCFLSGKKHIMGSKWMSFSYWYKTCRNMLRNNRVLTSNHLNKDNNGIAKLQMLPSIYRSPQLSLVLYSWMFFFSNIPVFIQMIWTLLFINRFLQVWYQNEEDTHLLPMIWF